MALAWHYTTADRWASIVEDGEIRPADSAPAASNIDAEIDEREASKEGRIRRAVVWFATRETWEPTAAMKTVIDRWTGTHHTLTVEELVELTGGLVRVGVLVTRVPFGWHHYVRTSGIRRKEAKGLERIGLEMGSDPSDWRVSYEPVPRSQWISVQRWDGERWIGVDSTLPNGT